MLRTYTTERGSDFDLDSEFLKRNTLLHKRPAPPSRGLGSVGLGRQLFPVWQKASKVSKESYEIFLQNVKELIGGEVSSAELQEYAKVLWRVFKKCTPSRSQTDPQSIQEAKHLLISAIGVITEEALLGTVMAFHELKDSIEKEGTQMTTRTQDRERKTKVVLLDEEFGSELQYNHQRKIADSHSLMMEFCELTEVELEESVQSTETKQNDHSQPSVQEVAQSLNPATPVDSGPIMDLEDYENHEAAESSKTKPDSKSSVQWIHDWCKRIARNLEQDSDQLSLAVTSALLTTASGNELGSEIGELIGWDHFDQIQELVEKREWLKTAISEAIKKSKESQQQLDRSKITHSSVTITSQSEKDQLKRQRKDRRKTKGTGTDLEWLSTVGFGVLLETSSQSKLWLFNGQELDTSGPVSKGGALPVGSSRKEKKGYEEILVPAPSAVHPSEDEVMVKISDLEDWCHCAFPGYQSLNRIQSRIYHRAFQSNENLLVCAPTGAGKTNIAMITVLREIGQHRRFGVIQKTEFKIVYVAPMKALASEMTINFSKRLAPLGITVKELTGDMQLTKRELSETQMIITTPEKWDVITRKGGDVGIGSLVKLLIIDEVHLLNDSRGPVIETIVARTLRQVEVSQSMIRIIGLSATLPNYKDVAKFLAVNLETGLFHFDASYRPVPLAMQFIGVSEPNSIKRNNLMDEICFEKVVHALRNGKQAMVFVHSRKATGKTGRMLAELSKARGTTALFTNESHEQYQLFRKEIQKSRNAEMTQLFDSGIGIHHAGMLRSDRNLMEKHFSKGMIQVLCCTATLAWGVNLPAHTVIIRGTQLYDSQKGKFTDLGLLDVQQIFGRAGRPQFDTSGEGIIITTHGKLPDYLGMLVSRIPIESKFLEGLVDHLNAEIVLGTISNLKEACVWLSYTYLYVRAPLSPLSYGLTWEMVLQDPVLEEYRRDLIVKAAKELDRCRMARFDERTGQLYITELGRVASHFYINHESIETFDQGLKSAMTIPQILDLISESNEFENIVVREDELLELDKLKEQCPFKIKKGEEANKVNVLIQSFVCKFPMESFSLIADMMYIAQNAPRICRALFEICIRRGWSSVSAQLLDLAKALELKIWPDEHPLRQLPFILQESLAAKLEQKGLWMDELYELDGKEIQRLIQHPSGGIQVKECLEVFPAVELDAQMHPITRSVVQVRLEITPIFKWNDRVHSNSMKWLIWVDDSETEHIYHQETWLLSKSMMKEASHKVVFVIPIFEPLPSQYIVRVINDQWLGAEATVPISFKTMILPETLTSHTELLDLDPLPITCLKNCLFEALYSFSHFNPIQTQAFHTLYHTNQNVLLGAPTGSGKTISAELAILRLFEHSPDSRVVYIAPLKALVRERLDDWGSKLCPRLGKKMVELTGDYTPDIRALNSADIIISTPEKWDGISRNWQSRSYVQRVGLMVIDEIHLLGADRGPIIEVIVSRMRYIASEMKTSIRVLGLSTALANAVDVAEWMGVMPLECHIQGYSGKFYCPRMASMNKPAYAAIQTHSPLKPVLVFVSSRRQTRLTALDLIAFAAANGRPQQFSKLSSEECEQLQHHIKDSSLQHTIQYGVGMHHAGLKERDRSIVEKLYLQQKIQILVATSTLAWGVNTPAHLVIIKGTEYYDAPTGRYVDMPITDLLQMMGRAGRPQFDAHGVAVIMVHEPKKSFYKKFLYEPFPVESSLPQHLADHLNAEIVAGTVKSKQDALDYLSWTFFHKRLLKNPSFYNLESTEAQEVSTFLSDLVQGISDDLEGAGCVWVEEDGSLRSLPMGRIASFFYIKHQTMKTISRNLNNQSDFKTILEVLCSAAEYDDLPLRHNEEKLNALLADQVRWSVDLDTVDDPHTKANLLLQAHLSRLPLPISDYITDTKSALDNSLRLLQAMVDISAEAGWLDTTLGVMRLIQSLMQARWFDESSLLTVPHLTQECVEALQEAGIKTLPELMRNVENKLEPIKNVLEPILEENQLTQAFEMCRRLPVVQVVYKGPSVSKRKAKECFIEVELKCSRSYEHDQTIGTAFAPRFPKIKDESWWLVVGNGNSHELLALKRISIPDNQKTHSRLKLKGETANQELKLFLISDCYLGLDFEQSLIIKDK
eukprot:g1527.t1